MTQLHCWRINFSLAIKRSPFTNTRLEGGADDVDDDNVVDANLDDDDDDDDDESDGCREADDSCRETGGLDVGASSSSSSTMIGQGPIRRRDDRMK